MSKYGTETWLLWYGLVFIVMVLFQPDGVAGGWQAWRARRAVAARSRHNNVPLTAQTRET